MKNTSNVQLKPYINAIPEQQWKKAVKYTRQRGATHAHAPLFKGARRRARYRAWFESRDSAYSDFHTLNSEIYSHSILCKAERTCWSEWFAWTKQRNTFSSLNVASSLPLLREWFASKWFLYSHTSTDSSVSVLENCPSHPRGRIPDLFDGASSSLSRVTTSALITYYSLNIIPISICWKLHSQQASHFYGPSPGLNGGCSSPHANGGLDKNTWTKERNHGLLHGCCINIGKETSFFEARENGNTSNLQQHGANISGMRRMHSGIWNQQILFQACGK